MAGLLEYKCPDCGGSIRFDVESRMMVCDYCSKTCTPDEYYENTVDSTVCQTDTVTDSGMISHICGSCGGEIICDETAATAVCPFCGGSVVVLGNVSGKFFPKLIVPPKVTKERALELVEDYISSNPFLTRSMLRDLSVTDITGVYLPMWAYDCEFDTDITLAELVPDSEFDTDITLADLVPGFISNFNILKRRIAKNCVAAHFHYQNIPIHSTGLVSENLLSDLGPYEFDTAVKYDPSYLSGFLFHRHFADPKEKERSLVAQINRHVSRYFAKISGLRLRIKPIAKYRDLKRRLKYTLFPVWLVTVGGADRDYTIAVNGKNGSISGELPMSRRRKLVLFLRTALLTAVGAFAALTAAVYLLPMLLA